DLDCGALNIPISGPGFLEKERRGESLKAKALSLVVHYPWLLNLQEVVAWHSEGRNLQQSAVHLDQGLERSAGLKRINKN
ncbi:MAG: hypothetical protein MJE68_17145, partial [Proteobacteria bacterium]|nr:hypothetical protein [Pseudomonadota bacterium]